MATYAEICAEIAELEKKAAEVRAQETSAAIAQIKQIMTTYNLSIHDIAPEAKKKARKVSAPVPVKYKNPATGETWTGRGRAPKWIDGQNRDQFLAG